MSDYTVRAISADGRIRGFSALTTDLVQELQRKHQTLPVVSAALGRTATMGAIMGCMLKEEKDRVTIQVDGDGPVGRMMVDANGNGEVRGTVDNPAVLLPLNQAGKLDVAAAVGKGSIYILKDLGLKEPYRGTSPIISGELAEDFTYYFTASEQIPSSVGLGVLVNRDRILTAGGYLIQVMPDAAEETISELEQRISSLTSLTDLLQNGVTPEELLLRLMGEGAEILERQPVKFQCRCSYEKTEAMLKSLGEGEIRSIIEELGQAEVICNFCNEKYLFDRSELEKMI
ncbi:Hsp33 family molecular chaperone HslO [Paenactinomyces guangxiensis]|uniref:33 kDa chaperonin n=1 Tax=Paenactinomyces guangxiensis TaxID=1490290 RepID=A0A7W1WTI3_9BACL|nr:Hsp33 family molecular chaperone HslO [Paenactinomyces guangxiensis]MBA4495801.1 Hsp33 family molecular chaperone HslO [Paenactinomyces guangxiensis]MBH8592891.1 Hsp33 family molecular chaperone HslO [Paenactinomyces guangxiensis]